jgi:hypothetical protein
MRRSKPWLSHLILYGCGYGVVEKSNFLMTFDEMRFFYILLSTMKCSGVPFTHIYEWKRHSPSSRSYGFSIWIVVVVIVAMGFSSMICLILLFSESNSELRLDSISLSLDTNGCLERHSSDCCGKVFCGSCTTFQCPSSYSITLIFMWLGLVVLRLVVLWVRAIFTILWFLHILQT